VIKTITNLQRGDHLEAFGFGWQTEAASRNCEHRLFSSPFRMYWTSQIMTRRYDKEKARGDLHASVSTDLKHHSARPALQSLVPNHHPFPWKVNPPTPSNHQKVITHDRLLT
jgi:hypothetical protein